MHDSLPEVDTDAVDLSVEMFGKKLNAPLLITGMTGGAARAEEINRTLARVAQELGIAFGVGSQRAMAVDPTLTKTFQVREVAPDIVLLGNLGGTQVAAMSVAEIQDVVGAIDADALCVHLNPAQELTQPEGDRNFIGVVDGLRRAVEGLSVPVIAKETGCGLSKRTLEKIKSTGVEWVDVSGAGGTTWVGVEVLRTPPAQRDVGQQFWEWGIPTAASICWAREMGFNIIGSGGLRNGRDAANAIALGADIAGMALPWLRAAFDGGEDAAMAFGETTIQALRHTCVLTGSKDIAALQSAPRLIGPRLSKWTTS